MPDFLGLYPRLGWFAPLVLGKVQPPGLSKGHRSGLFEGHRSGLFEGHRSGLFEGHRSGLFEGQRPGLFEGQRPGLIPAYGIAIGIGHRNGWRAESPVSCPGFVVGTDGSGLQPLDRFNARFPGAVPQAGMVRTFGAGEGPTARFVQGPTTRFVRGPTARPHPSLWHRHRNWASEWMEG